jgi:hypothetical protein
VLGVVHSADQFAHGSGPISVRLERVADLSRTF